jgi:hypothetical protein
MSPSIPNIAVELDARPTPAINRREFLGQAAKLAVTAAVAAPFVSRARVLGANERIGVGFIGVGRRGRTHLAVIQNLIKSG